MSLSQWYSRLVGKSASKRREVPPKSRSLRLEALEERAVPTLAGAVEISRSFPALGSNFRVVDSAVQRDGKTVVLSTFGTTGRLDFAVSRIAIDGTLDTAFGNLGTRTVNLGAGSSQLSDDAAASIAIDKNGLIYVGGSTRFPNLLTGRDAFLARFDQGGDLDTSFGSGGFVLSPVIGALGEGATDIAIQSDNKIAMVGNAIQASTDGVNQHDMFAARYNVDGSLDPTFDGDGIHLRTVAGTNEEARNVLVLSNGAIVVTGFSGTSPLQDSARLLMIRLLGSNGALDGSFATGGVATLFVGNADQHFLSETFPTAEVGTTRQVIVGGSVQGVAEVGNFAAIRVKVDGTADSSFGTAGIASADINENSADTANSLAMQRDGRIVLAGTSNNGFGDIFGVCRFNADGTRDTSFNKPNGVLTLPAGQIPANIHVLNSLSFLDPTDPNYTTVPFAFNRKLVVNGLNASGMFTVRMDGVTDPKAVNNYRGIDEDTPTQINVVANDVPARSADTLRVSFVGKPKNGTARIVNGTNVLYTPAKNFFGKDEFLYSMTDGVGGVATGKVIVTVRGVNDPPSHSIPKIINLPRSQTTGFFEPSTVRIFDDSGNNTIKVRFTVSQGAIGITERFGLNVVQGVDTRSMLLYGSQAELNKAFDTLFYRPVGAFVGSVQLTMASEDRGFSGVGGIQGRTTTTTINIFDRRPVISIPPKTTTTYSTAVGTTLNVSIANGLAKFFRDNDGDRLTISTTVPPARGTLVVRSNGSFTYTPPAGFRGQVVFTVQAFDGILFSDPLRITIKVG